LANGRRRGKELGILPHYYLPEWTYDMDPCTVGAKCLSFNKGRDYKQAHFLGWDLTEP
jgi:hypothetical protein